VSALVLVSGVLRPAHGGEVPATPRVPPQSELRLRLRRNAAQWLKEDDVPSVAVAYIEDGRVAWTDVYGEQSPGVPATATTLYNIASLTKPILAEVILRLDQGDRGAEAGEHAQPDSS
jgi:CubicO group peptidase (beta-lactamase class C family)